MTTRAKWSVLVGFALFSLFGCMKVITLNIPIHVLEAAANKTMGLLLTFDHTYEQSVGTFGTTEVDAHVSATNLRLLTVEEATLEMDRINIENEEINTGSEVTFFGKTLPFDLSNFLERDTVGIREGGAQPTSGLSVVTGQLGFSVDIEVDINPRIVEQGLMPESLVSKITESQRSFMVRGVGLATPTFNPETLAVGLSDIDLVISRQNTGEDDWDKLVSFSGIRVANTLIVEYLTRNPVVKLDEIDFEKVEGLSKNQKRMIRLGRKGALALLNMYSVSHIGFGDDNIRLTLTKN